MRTMVCGFLFHGASVLLVEKRKPEWQAGLLNGVGGKVEDGELPDAAMRREFFEETGLDVTSWQRFASEARRWEGHGVAGISYEVIFYRAKLGDVLQVGFSWSKPSKNDRGEYLYWFRHNGLAQGSAVGNLHWLIPLARDWRDVQASIVISSDIREQPTW